MKRQIAVLGSTGSIGTQALDVIRSHPRELDVEVLTAHSNAALLIRQAIEFKPNAVVIGMESLYQRVFEALDPYDIKVYAGHEAICQVVEMETIDMVLVALVGFQGLKPTLNALKAGKAIALANKETLVVAGEMVTGLAQSKGINIYPVDSEHSAIFQCLAGEFHNPVEKIILTASGGPFRGKDRSYLATVTKDEALKHPNWSMGNKVTIDSASLMNKGLEVIEAKWLFGLPPSRIEVVVHPQSIVHSLVQFTDGSIKAQLGLPDMRLPIQYALGYPRRLTSDFPRFSFTKYPQLTFENPDPDTFRCLPVAYEALAKGGNMACIMNAADEVAVNAFLRDEIGFLQIPDLIESCMEKISFVAAPSFGDFVATDTETRLVAQELIKSLAR
ncbi:MAG TPA: 1-deoxy-D-xylulose-5-phosphate reductoisomerase [Bacteroidales bacterium]|nr:1-deoxy-D-xylulose-5-phosphate reductoisomerase [Bacteroidales bacterium]HPT02658.1 1-deoxy-D-xylulose-5-phosphate reductoisomerase [Bacteroidales bacterium]